MVTSVSGSQKRGLNADSDEDSDDGSKKPRATNNTTPKLKKARSSTDDNGQPKTKLNRSVHQIKRMFMAQANLWKSFADSLEREPEALTDQQPWKDSIAPGPTKQATAIFAEHAPVTEIQAEVAGLKGRLDRVRDHSFERTTTNFACEQDENTNILQRAASHQFGDGDASKISGLEIDGL